MGLNVKNAHIITIITAEPTTTTRIDMSRSVRLAAGARVGASFARTSFNPALSAEKIVGIVLISVISPNAASAARHRTENVVGPAGWSGVICGMGIVLG